MEARESIMLSNLLAAMSPEELIIDKLESAILEWKADKTSDNFDKISVHAHLVVMKQMNNDHNIEEMNRIINNAGDAHDIMKTMSGDTGGSTNKS